MGRKKHWLPTTVGKGRVTSTESRSQNATHIHIEPTRRKGKKKKRRWEFFTTKKRGVKYILTANSNQKDWSFGEEKNRRRGRPVARQRAEKTLGPGGWKKGRMGASSPKFFAIRQ